MLITTLGDLGHMAPPDRTRKGLRWSRESDGAVAVVIGALLTFIIVVTLVGTYVLWYVPSNGDQLDTQYLNDTENSFLRMQDLIGNSSPTLGEFITQSFQLGVAGTPPFSSSTDSSISYANDTSYDTSLNFSLAVNVTYSNVHTTIVLNEHYNASGLISLDTNTPFVPSSNFYFQDDTIIMQQAGSNYSQIIGHLPLTIASNSSGLLLHAPDFTIYGDNTSLGTYGTTLLTMQFSRAGTSEPRYNTYFFTGQNVTVLNQTGGYTTAIVNNITLKSFYYNITSPQVLAWNTSLTSVYNRNGEATGNSGAGITWNFSNFNFSVYLKGDNLSIKSTKTLKPFSIELDYFVLRLLQI